MQLYIYILYLYNHMSFMQNCAVGRRLWINGDSLERNIHVLYTIYYKIYVYMDTNMADYMYVGK